MADGTARAASAELWVIRLGAVPYREALALQEAVRTRRQADELPDLLLLLEHPPVYTRGRRSGDGDLAFAPSWYEEQGIEVVDVDRGGLLTYHGPGQLVGYPIMRIQSAVAHVRAMEDGLVAALHDAGVAGARNRPDDGVGYMGVWVADRKIASVGVHVAQHVTTHGFAVNVDNDMRPWEWVVACGLDGVRMTSVAQELGEPDAAALTRPPATEPLRLARDPSPRLAAFADLAVARLAAAFGRTPVEVDPDALGHNGPSEAVGGLSPATDR